MTAESIATEALDRAGITSEVLARARVLRNRANGGQYAVWVRVDETRLNGRRLGAARLKAIFPEIVSAIIATNVGGPCYVVVSSKNSIPCLYIRARFGGDFREVCRMTHSRLSAEGLSMFVLDSTAPASALIQKGL